MDRRKAYPKGYRKHLQVCLKKPESVIAYRRVTFHLTCYAVDYYRKEQRNYC